MQNNNNGVIRDDIDEAQLGRLVRNFVISHANLYTPEERVLILKNMLVGLRYGVTNDLLRQIYDHLDVFNPSKNAYEGFINLINKYFSLDRNIVEVGGGHLPSLGTKIALRQHSGTITVYDPKLIVPSSDIRNLVLVKDKFREDTICPIKPSLMIGYMPCQGTKNLIRYACKNNIDFLVALCSCTNDRDMYDYDDYFTSWQSDVMYDASALVRKYNMGRLKVTTELSKYKNPNPIIYNKR